MFQSTSLARQPSIAIVAAMFAASPAAAQNDYYFGDSDLEQGNAQIIAGQTAADRVPYYCASGLCRDSNGPVWGEQLTPGLEAALAAVKPYTSLNFAVSGAHMTDRGDVDLPIATGVSTQIALFGALQDGGNIAINPSDRFFIHAGTNDMLRILEGEDPTLVQADVVDSARRHVSTLAARGARTIVVSLVQPVQYLPLLAGDDLAGLRSQAAQFVAATNAELLSRLGAAKAGLPAGTNIVLFDQPAFFEQLRANYAKLGFADFATACFDPATGVLCSTDPAQQNGHVFFDPNHLSTAGHRLLADWVRATLAGASGDASRSAGRMSDALASSAVRIAAETTSARHLMDRQDGHPFMYAAPIIAVSRYQDETGMALRLRQTGGLLGLQWPLGRRAFANLSFARLEQDARSAGNDRFTTSEWSMSGDVGLRLGMAEIVAHGSYARPHIRDFRRDTGALGLVATADRVSAEHYSAGAEIKLLHQWGMFQLQARTGLDYTHVRIDGFSESNATGLALRYDRQSSGGLFLQTNTRLVFAPAASPGTVNIAPYVELGNRSWLAGDSRSVTSTLIGNIADSAILRSRQLNDDGLRLGGGVDVGLGRQVRLEMAGERTLGGNNNRSYAVSARFAIAF